MEVYRVENVRPYNGSFYQALDLVGVNKKASLRWKGFRIYRIRPVFQVGDNVKLYSFHGIDGLRAFKAYSYKIGGKTFVDIQTVPVSQYGIEHFYDELSKWDALRLRYDVFCALQDKKIQPTFNAANNLRLLLFDPSIQIKEK